MYEEDEDSAPVPKGRSVADNVISVATHEIDAAPISAAHRTRTFEIKDDYVVVDGVQPRDWKAWG